MEDYRSTKCKAMCPASCSKCLRLRTDLDLRSATMKYRHYKNEEPSSEKEHGGSYLNVTENSVIKAREIKEETIYQYAPKCPLCKLILPQIRNLLRDISIIDIACIPGICKHCKNINSTLQCQKCDDILKRYMQEKECYIDHCNKECHEVIAQIKTLLSEFEKHEELMKLKSLSLDELLKFLKPSKTRNINTEQQDTQGTCRGIPAGTQGFRSTCVCDDLLKKLHEKMASIDFKNYEKSLIGSKISSYKTSRNKLEKTKNIARKQKYSKSLIDSKISPYDVSDDQLGKTKNIERKQKFGRSDVDDKIPSKHLSHDQLEKPKTTERQQKYGKSYDEDKRPSYDISQDHLEKNVGRQQKKRATSKTKNDKDAIDFDEKVKSKPELRKKVKSSESKRKQEEINKMKDNKDAHGLNIRDKHKFEFKQSGAKDEIVKTKRDKKTKTKKESDTAKQNDYNIDTKKIKVRNKSLDQMEKMILSQKKKRKRDGQYNIKRFKMPKIGELPPLPTKKIKKRASDHSESFIEWGNPSENDFIEVIEGNVIKRYKRGRTRVEPKTRKPLFFNVTHNFGDESISDINLLSPVHSKTKSLYKKDELFGKYRLSNRKYIESGWTVLPTSTVVRRLNIYKMVPSDGKFDWQGSHKNEDIIFYDTGEVLAEVNDNGLFKWFYRDGNVALEFIDVFDSETNATKEYVVYDLTKDKGRYEDKVKILASFDDKGHGIVFDRFGSTRIKYNQYEGLLFDKHIGSPCHWKWNTLNEPPKIQVEHVFEFMEPLDPIIEKLEGREKDGNIHKDDEITSLPRSEIRISTEFDDKMKEIELNNVIREKSMKIMMKYKPFEVRSKIFKLNDHFSLRLLGQSKIYILFRDGKISLKLNVGMKLIGNEVVDIKTVNKDIIEFQENKYKQSKSSLF